MKELFTVKGRLITEVAIAAILLLVPFHAFLTILASQSLGHYTLLRLWKEVLLVIIVLAAGTVLARCPGLRRQVLRDRLFQCIVAFVLLYLIDGLLAVIVDAASLKTSLYGVLIGTRFLVFFMAVWIIAHTGTRLWRWRYKLLLGPALVVVVFGLLQRFVLPYDVLRHVGYGPETIRPYQTIDRKTSYFRIISTLRGANPLGAYMVVVLCVLVARFFAGLRKVPMLLFILAALIVLAATYSRSAWIGAFVGVGLITASKLKHLLRVRRAVMMCIAGSAIIAICLFSFRSNDFVQNTFFHTDEHSVATNSSNHDHASASTAALKEVVTEPLGRGPGTAGQASVYNVGHPARIAENYYLQVAQEVGWLGLGLFIAIYVLIAKRLYAVRQDPLALGLLASFIGLVVVNLLSHAWADDTLAYVWWGFTGLALGTLPRIRDEKAE